MQLARSNTAFCNKLLLRASQYNVNTMGRKTRNSKELKSINILNFTIKVGLTLHHAISLIIHQMNNCQGYNLLILAATYLFPMLDKQPCL